MIAVDNNILVYAHREELPQHRAARTKLTALAEGEQPWGIPVFGVAELVRVITDAVREADAVGNLVFDAQIVAVCRESRAW